MFKRNPSIGFAEDGGHVVIEWNSFPKEEAVKGSGYWTSRAGRTWGRQRTQPLFISLYLERKITATWSLALSCWDPRETSVVFGLWSFW